MLEWITRLPPELVDHVLAYNGYVNRCGKYMQRLSKDDARYRLFERVPQPTVNVHRSCKGEFVFVYIDFYHVSEEGRVVRNITTVMNLQLDQFTYWYQALLYDKYNNYFLRFNEPI